MKMRAVWNIKEDIWKFRQHDKGNMKYKKKQNKKIREVWNIKEEKKKYDKGNIKWNNRIWKWGRYEI